MKSDNQKIILMLKYKRYNIFNKTKRKMYQNNKFYQQILVRIKKYSKINNRLK